MRDTICFYINGIKTEVNSASEAGMMLAEYLRLKKHQMGTKVVCSEGDCGACSVLVQYPGFKSKAQYQTINSCVRLVGSLDGASIVTVDGLASDTSRESAAGDISILSPVQKAMVECHGSQCGFCTPGFVVALTGLVEKKKCERQKVDHLTEADVKNATTGNLCRCTGYESIIKAGCQINPLKVESVTDRYLSSEEKKILKNVSGKSVELSDDHFTFFAPTSLKEALVWLKKNKQAKVLAGSTDLGVLHNKYKARILSAISLHLIPELSNAKLTKNGFVTIGASTTITELRDLIKHKAPELARYLDIFASPQIKNVATVVGNIVNASPISDMPAALMLMDTEIEVADLQGKTKTVKKRTIKLEDFYLGYKKTALKPGEIVVGLRFTLPTHHQKYAIYKVSNRRDLDISTVNMGILFDQKIGGFKVALGGVAATPIRLKLLESYLGSCSLFDLETLSNAKKILRTEVQPISDLRGSKEFRKILLENLIERFFRENIFTDSVSRTDGKIVAKEVSL